MSKNGHGSTRRKQTLFRKNSISLESVTNQVEFLSTLPKAASKMNMEELKLFDPLASCSGDSEEDETHTHQFEEKMRQLSESILPCKRCGSERQSMLEDSSSRRLYRSSSEEMAEFQHMKHEVEELRRDNNRMVLEAAYLRKENSSYLKRIREENIIRERLKNQVLQLRNKIDSRSTLDDIDLVNCTSIDSDVIKEQLKVYREDFQEEKRIREKYCARNIELENQLEEAKQTLEMQQKKLLLYSQLFSQPFRTKLDLPILNSSSGKSYSVPGSPSCNPTTNRHEKKRSSPHYHHSSNDHIIEATFISGEKPRIKRSSTPDSTEYYSEGNRGYKTFDWGIDDREDIISK